MNTPLQAPELDAARRCLLTIREEVGRIFLGEPRILDILLTALMARGHVLLEGVPGIAKTTLVKALAASLSCTVRRVQFTPDLLPADITGTYVLNPREGTFSLRQGPIFANLVLADEINRAPAKTQSALLEAMQERQVTVEGDRYELPQPFFVLATQNPIDLLGTYPLPEAQLDRFLVRVSMGYPLLRDEVAMLRTHTVVDPEPHAVVSTDQLTWLQGIADRVHVEEDLYEYAARLCTYTRSHPSVVLGASPRASLGLLRIGKAHAVLEGRAYLTPDDLRAMAEPVLVHRLVMLPDLEGQEQLRTQLVEEAVLRVPYRREVRAV